MHGRGRGVSTRQPRKYAKPKACLWVCCVLQRSEGTRKIPRGTPRKHAGSRNQAREISDRDGGQKCSWGSPGTREFYKPASLSLWPIACTSFSFFSNTFIISSVSPRNSLCVGELGDILKRAAVIFANVSKTKERRRTP